MNDLQNIKHVFFLLLVLIVSGFPVHSESSKSKAVLVSNNLAEFNAVQGKLKLTLVRVWGENEEDEYIQSPHQVLTSKTNDVYICDMNNHVVKVFDRNGTFLRSIGRPGRGPGDFSLPASMALSPTGDLWVAEIGGLRVQRFSPRGKSLHIFKHASPLYLIGITANDELIVNDHNETLKTGKLAFIMDGNGKSLRSIGTYHDPDRSFVLSERLLYAADERGNLYVSSRWAGVVRKYAPNGEMRQCFTFETPLKGYYNVRLNNNGNEIERVNPGSAVSSAKDQEGGEGILLAPGERKQMPDDFVSCIGVDSGNVFIAVPTRKKSKEEEEATKTVWSNSSGIVRIVRDYSVLEKMDIYTLLVFNKNGKLIAASKLKTPEAQFHISGDQLFIVDGFARQLTQYKMTFVE